MNEYHKISTVFNRDPATKYKTLIDGDYAKPEFKMLKGINWICTEKVDGTNIRVIFDGEKVTFGGKTDRAQIPATLIKVLQEKFYTGAMAEVFDCPACLYGEGYGAKIQKGSGNYIPDGQDFILFDVKIGDVWLNRESIVDIAHKLQIDVVPVRSICTLTDAIEMCRSGFRSDLGDLQAEGLVCRPEIELKDGRGHRVITKIKCKDFI